MHRFNDSFCQLVRGFMSYTLSPQLSRSLDRVLLCTAAFANPLAEQRAAISGHHRRRLANEVQIPQSAAQRLRHPCACHPLQDRLGQGRPWTCGAIWSLVQHPVRKGTEPHGLHQKASPVSRGGPGGTWQQVIMRCPTLFWAVHLHVFAKRALNGQAEWEGRGRGKAGAGRGGRGRGRDEQNGEEDPAFGSAAEWHAHICRIQARASSTSSKSKLPLCFVSHCLRPIIRHRSPKALSR